VVVITGSTRGLGLALSRKLGRAGCRLAICARDEAELDRARQDLEQRGVEVLAVRCDVSVRTEIDQLVAATRARFGAIDIVINNAGIVQVGPLEAMSIESFELAMAVDFWGPLHLISATLPHMRARRRGHVVNITSIGGKVAIPHLLPYSAAKGALIQLSEGLTAELAKDDIHVTTIIPGLLRTGSPTHVPFLGDAPREFAWFSLGDSLRLTSMSAERAASRIVTAIRLREREVVLSWQAKALRLVHDLFPATTVSASVLVNRLLPGMSAGDAGRETLGMDIAPSALTTALTENMRAAAEDLNQNRDDRERPGRHDS
jgi:short-subunit dehydrogenase